MNTPFQSEPNTIRWKVHFRSTPAKVFRALTDSGERAKYWADSVEEIEGKLHYDFKSMGFRDEGRILRIEAEKSFSVEYLGTEVTFNLSQDGSDGTDLQLIVKNVPESLKVELIAGWVNFLMTMKGAVDFGVDLRNHDPERTWDKGYVEN